MKKNNKEIEQRAMFYIIPNKKQNENIIRDYMLDYCDKHNYIPYIYYIKSVEKDFFFTNFDSMYGKMRFLKVLILDFKSMGKNIKEQIKLINFLDERGKKVEVINGLFNKKSKSYLSYEIKK